MVAEVRYKPKMSYYRLIDPAVEKLEKEFPDWERSPQKITMWNPATRKMIQLANGRFRVEALQTGDSTNRIVTDIATLFTSLVADLEFTEVRRFGFRQWWAIESNESFPSLSERLSNMFFHPELVENSLHHITDMAYVVDLDVKKNDWVDDGWSAHFSLGPMTSEEFIAKTGLSNNIAKLSADSDTQNTDEIVESIPDILVSMDLDNYVDDIEATDLQNNLRAFQSYSTELFSEMRCRIVND